ncbi:uncharacterized protein [Apostichopus japonicus]|uniref:uncharacterized protein isoform X2 n=1 Tax=Stichopus japonicus TaxID=307972 RepID=UPI003AB52F90
MGDVEELVASEVDVISITCSDDDDYLISEELEDTKRDKFRLERQVKKEKVDNYPQYGGVITTILPLSVTPAVPIPEARASVCPDNVNAALPNDRDSTTSVMQHEASEATDKVTDKVKPSSEAKKIINRKFFSEGQSNSGRCTATKTVDRKHSNVRMEKRPLPRCRKQPMRNVSCLDRGEPSRGNQDLWERMQEMQYHNNQLTNLVENLYVKLNEKSNLEKVICTKARRYRQELSHQRPEVIINPVDDPINQRDIYNEEKEENILKPQRRLHRYESNGQSFPDQPRDIYQGRMVGLDEGIIPSVTPDQPEFTKLRERGVHARARFIQGSERGDRNWSDRSDREVPYREFYEEDEDATEQIFPRRSMLGRRAEASDDLDKNRPAVPRCYRSPTINTSPVIQSQPLREWEDYRQDDLEDGRRAGYNYPSYSRENSYEIPDVHRGFVDRGMDGSEWQNSQRRVVYGGEMAVHDLISDHPYHALAGINRMVHHQGPVRQQERHHWGSERRPVVDNPHRLINERQLAQRVGRRILSRQQALLLQGPTQLQETRSAMMENRIRSLRNQGGKRNQDGYWRRKHLIAQNEYTRRYDLEDHPELVQCQGTMRNF